MNDREAPGRLGLLDLVEVGRWQRLQDHFADVVGIALRTVSPTHALVVNPSWPMGLRSDRTIEALQIGDELEGLLPQHNLPQTIASVTAPLGVSYAAVPIRVMADRPLAYFVLGPMVVGRREDELHFQQRTGEMGLDGRVLWTLLQSLKIYTFAGMHSVLNLMAEVSDALVQVAYQAKQLQAIFPTTGKVDQAVVTFYTNRVFTSLLEAATLATKADGGSVMVRDRPAGVFRIGVSQGLSDEVVRNAAVRPGEGIAGLAAQQRGDCGPAAAGRHVAHREFFRLQEHLNRYMHRAVNPGRRIHELTLALPGVRHEFLDRFPRISGGRGARLRPAGFPRPREPPPRACPGSRQLRCRSDRAQRVQPRRAI